MSIDYTSVELINEVKLRMVSPTSQSLFEDYDYARFLNSAQHSIVIPAINRAKEDYFVTSSDTAIVSGTSSYRIPSEAIGGQLKDIVLVNSNGSEMELARLDIVDQKRASYAYGVRFNGDSVVLLPTPTDSSLSLRFYYKKRTNNIAARVSYISNTAGYDIFNYEFVTEKYSTTIIEFADTDNIFLPTISGFTNPTSISIIKNSNPFYVISNHTVTNIDQANKRLTISPAMSSDVAITDYVADFGFTPMFNFTYEGHLVCCQFAAALAMKAMGDLNRGKEAYELGKLMLDDFLRTINPRLDGEAKRVVSPAGGILDYMGEQMNWRSNVGP